MLTLTCVCLPSWYEKIVTRLSLRADTSAPKPSYPQNQRCEPAILQLSTTPISIRL